MYNWTNAFHADREQLLWHTSFVISYTVYVVIFAVTLFFTKFREWGFREKMQVNIMSSYSNRKHQKAYSRNWPLTNFDMLLMLKVTIVIFLGDNYGSLKYVLTYDVMFIILAVWD